MSILQVEEEVILEDDLDGSVILSLSVPPLGQQLGVPVSYLHKCSRGAGIAHKQQ